MCCRAQGGDVQGPHTGEVLQLLALGDCLLSLGDDRKLLVWTIGEYGKPKVIGLPCSCGSRASAGSCMQH